MSEPKADLAAPLGAAARRTSHAHPHWEGAQSRHHRRDPMWRFCLHAIWEALARRRAFGGLETMVNFVGYPRSGHSLIGSILDGHPACVMAHELDALGLLHKGIPARQLPGLMARNSDDFSRAGRWWNGFCYDIGTGNHGMQPGTRVIGDKKGDWAARWSALRPDLIGRLAAGAGMRSVWILVTRHPLDNIATLSLRKSKAYDRLRIDLGRTGDFPTALRAAQARGDIDVAARDDMVQDWRAMSAAVAQMKAQVPPEDWHEIVYERFTADPESHIARLAQTLDLPENVDWLDRATAAVRPTRTLSRDSVTWRDDQIAAVRDTVAAHDFLGAYADDL